VLAFFIAFNLFHEHNLVKEARACRKMSRVFLFAFVPALSPVRVVVVWWILPEENSDYQYDKKYDHVLNELTVHF
jgi:hypothetical protein